MALYNTNGNIRVAVDDTSLPFGLYAADGALRVTVVDGSTLEGLYAPDGSLNVISVDVTDLPVSAYHPCGALRAVPADGVVTGIRAPNGALYMDGLTSSTYAVIAAAGSYTITGSSATLMYTPANAYAMAADSGSYTITGTAATLSTGVAAEQSLDFSVNTNSQYLAIPIP
jgi:hypothetical protein